jgi:hypothetical protein
VECHGFGVGSAAAAGRIAGTHQRRSGYTSGVDV